VSRAKLQGGGSDTGCFVSQTFATRGKRSYPDWWVITSDPRYLGYKIPIVASEPFIERVARVVHSMGGRIGTLMLLRVPLQDSDSRPWGIAV
jgi:hypothetical protein